MSSFFHIIFDASYYYSGDNVGTIYIEECSGVKGSVRCSGSKNAILPIIACSMLIDRTVITNPCRITDVLDMCEILRYLGGNVRWVFGRLYIDCRNIVYKSLNIEAVKRIRASYYFIPVMLIRFGKCEIAYPGGCGFSSRPIDRHIELLKGIGCSVLVEDNKLMVSLDSKSRFNYRLEGESVGASINAIICATMGGCVDGVLFEPEVLDVFDFLTKAGFMMRREGRSVFCDGGKPVGFLRYRVIPDRIEAMSYMIMGLMYGDIRVKGVNVSHISTLVDKLSEASYDVRVSGDSVRCKRGSNISIDCDFDVYPQLPTDIQPILGVMLQMADGECVIRDFIYPGRTQIYDDMRKCGCENYVCDGEVLLIGSKPHGVHTYTAVDLRHAFSLVLLSMYKGGVIKNFEVINRGYNDILGVLGRLGVKFRVIL